MLTTTGSKVHADVLSDQTFVRPKVRPTSVTHLFPHAINAVLFIGFRTIKLVYLACRGLKGTSAKTSMSFCNPIIELIKNAQFLISVSFGMFIPFSRQK